MAVLELATDAAGRFDPRLVLDELRRRGLGRVLVEGGGRTVSSFLTAGLLDRLYLTSAPILLGDGVPGIRFTGGDLLSDALSAPVRRFALGTDLCTVFDFDGTSGSAVPLRQRQGQQVPVADLDGEVALGQLG